MYITGFLTIIESNCIGMDWSRKLQSFSIYCITVLCVMYKRARQQINITYRTGKWVTP